MPDDDLGTGIGCLLATFEARAPARGNLPLTCGRLLRSVNFARNDTCSRYSRPIQNLVLRLMIGAITQLFLRPVLSCLPLPPHPSQQGVGPGGCDGFGH